MIELFLGLFAGTVLGVILMSLLSISRCYGCAMEAYKEMEDCCGSKRLAGRLIRLRLNDGK